MNLKNSSEPTTSPAVLRNIVTEILQSEQFCNQLQCCIERASHNITTAPTVQNAPAASTPQIPVATPAEELRRLFPSIRTPNNTSIHARNTEGRNCSSRKRRRGSQKMNLPEFKRDIVLVRNPEVTKTLNGYQKSTAYATGYAVSAATFQRSWTEYQIFEYIESLFKEKLHGIKFEILIPIAGNLVKPNIPEGTLLDGTTMCHLFLQKVIYVRPFSDIAVAEQLSDIKECSQDFYEMVDNQQMSEPEVDIVESNSNHSLDAVFENDTAIAIKNSLEFREIRKENIFEVLKELNNRIDVENISYFNIYRKDIFNCCLRAIKRKSFSPLNKISVVFTDIDNVSEGAIDMGGPTKEMFRLLLKYLANDSKLFEGTDNSKNITLYSDQLESKNYYEAGRLIALSLIHGGPAPHFFSETLFNYLVNGADSTRPSVEEIMNMEIRDELEKIRNTSDLCELQLEMWNSSFLQVAGITNITDFEKKNVILQSAAKYYIIHRATPALEQFKAGLNILGLLDKLKEFEEFRELMCFIDCKLTANKISSLFNVKLSEFGSNYRDTENRILTFWEDFLLDCQEGEVQATLGDVLCFATACEQIPPLGFQSQPTIEFLHEEDFLWPKANTCTPILFLPVSYQIHEYEKFKNNMVYAILNGMEFGFA